MAKKTVAVYDGSEGYISRLLEYVCQREAMHFEIRGFYDLEALEQFLNETRVEILLFSMEELVEGTEDEEAQMERFIHHDNVEEFIYFGERRNSRSQIRHIKKYQSAESILEELEDLLFTNEEQASFCEEEGNGKYADLVGIYSPAGDAQHSIVAYQLAEMLASEMRTLLVDLDRYSLFPFTTGIKENGKLSDLMYLYKTNPQNLKGSLKGAVQRFHGFDILSSPASMEDIDVMKEDEWTRFLQTLARCGNYESVLVYMGEAFRSPEDFMEYCDVIYLPVSEGAADRFKINRFAQTIIDEGREDLLEKVHGISLRKEEKSEDVIAGELGWLW